MLIMGYCYALIQKIKVEGFAFCQSCPYRRRKEEWGNRKFYWRVTEDAADMAKADLLNHKRSEKNNSKQQYLAIEA